MTLFLASGPGKPRHMVFGPAKRQRNGGEARARLYSINVEDQAVGSWDVRKYDSKQGCGYPTLYWTLISL